MSLLILFNLFISFNFVNALNLQKTIEHFYWEAKAWIKIYTPPEYQNFTFNFGKPPEYIGTKIHFKRDTELLGRLENWLYTHDEFKGHEYVRQRLNQDVDLFTSKIDKAVLCFPGCKYGNDLNANR
jgi:hypothetical protein